jgi:hypothetical protein
MSPGGSSMLKGRAVGLGEGGGMLLLDRIVLDFRTLRPVEPFMAIVTDSIERTELVWN